jgi:hypothetical protein
MRLIEHAGTSYHVTFDHDLDSGRESVVFRYLDDPSAAVLLTVVLAWPAQEPQLRVQIPHEVDLTFVEFAIKHAKTLLGDDSLHWSSSEWNVFGKIVRWSALSGTDVPGRLARWTPKGRAQMRRLLQQYLDQMESHDASAAEREAVRRELRRYGG